MSPSHANRFIVNTSSPTHTAEGSLTASVKQRKPSEKSVISPFKKRSSVKNEGVRQESGKKPETSPIPARYGGKRPSLTKSSSAYFPNSATPENGAARPPIQKGTPTRGGGGGIKGIWKRNSRKKTAVKMESEEWVDVGAPSDQSPSRELPRRLSLRRKNSISADKVCHLCGVCCIRTYTYIHFLMHKMHENNFTHALQ